MERKCHLNQRPEDQWEEAWEEALGKLPETPQGMDREEEPGEERAEAREEIPGIINF